MNCLTPAAVPHRLLIPLHRVLIPPILEEEENAEREDGEGHTVVVTVAVPTAEVVIRLRHDLTVVQALHHLHERKHRNAIHQHLLLHPKQKKIRVVIIGATQSLLLLVEKRKKKKEKAKMYRKKFLAHTLALLHP